MSILLTVAALVFVSVLPGQEAGDINQKELTNVKKLEYVENAMRSFMASKGRRPCPADGQYGINTANFGIEGAIPGTCIGGGPPVAPLGPDAGTSHVVGGVIPTKTLNIPDDYAFDAWGRRFTYVVDTAATLMGTCTTMMNFPTNNGTGHVQIKDGTGTVIDTTMYAYISHGPDGHGAWPEQGGAGGLTGAQSAALRINIGSTDADQNTNAAASNDGNMTYSTSNLKSYFVQKDKTATFDDMVWYRPDLKNTCCLGMVCVPLGFRIDGTSTTGQLRVAGIGDIDNDGYADLVLTTYFSATRYVYVIFGTPTGWPVLPSSLTVNTLNGTNGFAINFAKFNSDYNPQVTVGDINGDGYADIFIAGGQSVGNKSAILFGGPKPWPAVVDPTTFNGYTGVNGTSGVIINNIPFAGEGAPAIGHIDDSPYPALISFGSGKGYVFFGKPNTGSGVNGASDNWTSTKTIDISTLDGTYGFQIYSSDSTLFGALGSSNNDSADFDHDGKDDITITAWGASPNPSGGPHYGSEYVIYGRSRANWQSVVTGSPAKLDISAELNATPNRATRFYSSTWNGPLYVFVADTKGDGLKDLVLDSQIFYNVSRYAGSRWGATYDMNSGIPAGQGFTLNIGTWPNWALWFEGAKFADVNGDGCADMLVTGGDSVYAGPLGRNRPGAVLVFLQPKSGGTCSGWPSSVNYNSFHWDGTDSFQIDGPIAYAYCDQVYPFVGDVRPGDNSPEIMISCEIGENSNGSIYGLYRNKQYGDWPAVRDLNDLN